MIINIISLPKRVDRREAVIRQMEMEKCSYRFFDGVVGKVAKTNISKAHKSVVRFAKEQGLKECAIAEDDMQWCGTNAWKYFLDNKPNSFDIYIASYYSGSHDENFVVTGLRGLTLYIVNSCYYDTFLSLPEDTHIDGAIDRSGAKVVVSPLFVAVQAPGYSDQRKRQADDSNRLKGKPIFGHENQ
jgi:hypothetical protein